MQLDDAITRSPYAVAVRTVSPWAHFRGPWLPLMLFMHWEDCVLVEWERGHQVLWSLNGAYHIEAAIGKAARCLAI